MKLEDCFHKNYINWAAPWKDILILLFWAPFGFLLVVVRTVFLVALIPVCVSFFCGCFVKKTHNKTKQFLLVKRDWHPDTVRLILPWFGIIVDYSGPIYGEEFSFPSLVWWVTVFFSPFVCCWLSCQSMPDKSNKMFSCNHATGDLDFFPFMSVLRAGPLVNEKYFRDSALAQVLETKIYNNMNR